MTTEDTFADLLQRIRAGDAAAAEKLVERYQPALRRMVHVRLVGDRLRRLFDSEDICQSVLASFFVRMALGQYDLEQPEDLLKLLAVMARNKATLSHPPETAATTVISAQSDGGHVAASLDSSGWGMMDAVVACGRGRPANWIRYGP